MLRNRLLFLQNDKNKKQAITAISRKSQAAHNTNLCAKPKARLAAILPALVVTFTGAAAIGSAFSAIAANNESAQTRTYTKEGVETHFTVIAHRGASGYLPEHTLEAATLAFSLRPDFIEQDVVITKDDIPVVLHDIHLETVTNVEDVFPARHRDDGRFYARDFTLEELRQLRVHERANSDGKQVFKDRYRGTHANFKVATLNEHFELISELNRQFGTSVGVYPEVKSPAFHIKEGIDASKIVVDALNAYGFGGESGNSYLQCFDFNEVKRIRETLGYKGKIVMLIGENDWGESDTDYDWLRTQEGMQQVALYADGIGPWLGHLLDNEAMAQGKIEAATWINYAHENNLTIHPYTYRHDALPAGMSSQQVLDVLHNVVDADGVFTDHLVPVLTWRDKQN
ncbi:glycerophosphodiester phosphodiesterase [Alteromonas portus]|uniref:glycerophosphodiester phosphodiesterase n=1 Tax=Alteromonas portus TaxID=2565549 RepID=A0A4U0ZG69_9ALTE|nr:glycerophosphodiester phosphodiesterase [Alteromonas portus]TKB05088.1 glycerophosphodiester phosphodiesterase [Alteromonas portus]